MSVKFEFGEVEAAFHQGGARLPQHSAKLRTRRTLLRRVTPVL